MSSHPILNSNNLKQYGITDFSSSIQSIPSTLDRYNKWVQDDKHLPLMYLEGHRQDLRQDLKTYFPEFEQSVTFLFSYAKTWRGLRSFYKNNKLSNGLKISSYVLGFGGVDYHHIVKKHLEEISLKLQEIDPELLVKLSLDIHPVLERDMAVRSGLGWFGKNSMFISKTHGSFTILGSILLSKKILDQQESPIEVDHCGQCSRCIEACPTDAIDKNSRTLIASKCISTFTIEMFKDTQAPEGMEKAEGEIFGCDICQDVCPFNLRLIRQNTIPELSLEELEQGENGTLFNYFLKRPIGEIISSIKNLSNRRYQKDFYFSSLSRTGRVGMLKNLFFYKKP